MSKFTQWRLLILLIFCGSAGLGCASAPYQFGRFHDKAASEMPPTEVAFEYGKPNTFLDRMAWMVGFPSRILPMSPNVNNHKFSQETSDKLTAYMQENDITDVLVRVNQYDPKGEWRRLRENKRIAPGWKYTFGAAGLVGYTIFPGRVFGGDTYNPFTNSLYVNSDVPAMLIVEAAYAKDIHGRNLPGTYAAINEIPVLTLWRHTRAVNDTLGYALMNDDWEVERETYRVVYPLLGIHAALGGHSAVSFATPLPMLTVPISAVGGAVAGHTVGRSTIARRERERANESQRILKDSEELDYDDTLESRLDPESGIQLTGMAEPVGAEAGTNDMP